MNRVRLLPEQVANQIAAGEVIERPASVVKELVENALDADARHIQVEIQAGGRSLIRVTDEGFGMSRDDALLCLERHATSKIQRADDLSSIASFGFRGEALPSIASVSRFSLTTRERSSQDPDSTQILVQGGKIQEVRSSAGAPGTTVEVRQLFFNLPARRKFLRTEETERAHIQHYLVLAALAHPLVGFSYTSDHRTVWQVPALTRIPDPAWELQALEQRYRALHSAQTPLLRVDVTGRLDPSHSPDDPDPDLRAPDAPDPTRLRLWGVIGAPGVSRGNREEQHLFVNRRPVDNRALNFALTEAYHTALMKGRYPVCTLFLEIDPAQVDVNIHPAKREVRFHQESRVRSFVLHAVRRTLLLAAPTAVQDPPSRTQPASPGTASTKPSGPSSPAAQGRDPEDPHTAEFPLRWPTPRSAPTTHAPPPPSPPTPPPYPPPAPPAPGPPPAAGAPTPAPTPVPGPPPATPPPTLPPLEVPLRVVGVIGRLYVVLESDRGLVLMDQHAAHERILFEEMLRRLDQGDAPSQRLLLPETVELAPRDAQFVRDNLAVFNRLGVGLAEFGERTFLLDGLPPFVKSADPRRFVHGLIDELKATGGDVNSFRLGEQAVAKTVCRHAVKANDALSPAELERLVCDLRACAMPYTCPHGRPILIEFSLRELDRKFGRTA